MASLSIAVWITIFCATFVSAQDLPEITKTILPEIRRAGTTGYLNCSVIRQGDYNVKWQIKSTQYEISTNDKIDLNDNINYQVDHGYRKYQVLKYEDGGETTYVLIIRRLQITDSGFYTCYVQLTGQNTPNPTKDGEMVVLSPPSVEQGPSSQTFRVREGTDVELFCAAAGFPQPNITWVRPNGRSIPAPYNRFSVRNQTIVMGNINREDRGVYRCVADNNVRPPAHFDVTIYVEFPPTAKPVQTSYGQAANRQYDITIECRISGLPQPDIQWYKKSKEGTGSLRPINNDEKHYVHFLLNHGQTLSITEIWFQLVIVNVQADDYGTYVCEGSNRLGSNTTEVVLYETSECQGPFCLEGSSDTSSAMKLLGSLIMLASTYLLAFL